MNNPGIPPPVTFKMTGTVLAHVTSYTIAHEVGWHKAGGTFGEGSVTGPGAAGVHLGVNDLEIIIPNGFVVNGMFPPYLNPENQALQLCMGYLVE